MGALVDPTSDIGTYLLRLSNILLLSVLFLQQWLHTPLLVVVEVCDTLLSDLTNNNRAAGNTSFGPVRLVKLVLVGSTDLVLLCWPLLLVALHRPLPLEQCVLVEVEFVVVDLAVIGLVLVLVGVVVVVIGNRTLPACIVCSSHKLPEDNESTGRLD